MKPARLLASRLLVVQPYLTAYRLPVFAELAQSYRELVIAASPAPSGSGYGEPDVSGTAIARLVSLPEVQLFGGRLFWQRGLVGLLLRLRPDKMLIAANPRYLSFWAALLLSRMIGTACYSYGQGFYDKLNPPRWLVLTYRLLVASSRCYICYTQSGVDSLRAQGVRGALAVAENSLRVVAPTKPEQKTGREAGVLYLGRLREGCQLQVLIAAMATARHQSALDLQLHIVGGGAFAQQLKRDNPDLPWLHWHGEIYEQARVREIAVHCRVGCHPGHAGLSVVHFMGLSLVPVIHDRLDLHMGPEPSFVMDQINGRRFSYAQGEASLAAVLTQLFDGRDVPRLSQAAFATYKALNDPSLAERLIRALQAH